MRTMLGNLGNLGIRVKEMSIRLNEINRTRNHEKPGVAL